MVKTLVVLIRMVIYSEGSVLHRGIVLLLLTSRDLMLEMVGWLNDCFYYPGAGKGIAMEVSGLQCAVGAVSSIG